MSETNELIQLYEATKQITWPQAFLLSVVVAGAVFAVGMFFTMFGAQWPCCSCCKDSAAVDNDS